ncbi:hypothetical protein AN958_07940 [Leucoagaricus sp. SymC.cos]|nr:hypothetical protein AN958_07940 [Leucoagaricus sp. SymC.cos]
MYLEARDIELELLPNGMERRLLNQSVWEQKNQTALLTIQFRFHPPAEARSASSETVKPFTLLTHRNDISIPLLTLVQKHIQERMNKKSNTKPTTNNQSSSSTSSLLSSRTSTLNSANTKPKVYYSLDPNEPLLQSLRGTQFIEFPLIEVWEELNGVIVDRRTGGVRHASRGQEEEPRRKRRKLNPEEGLKAINGLLGDYGSEDEEGEEEGQTGEKGVRLVGYVESDAEEEGQDNAVDEEVVLDEDEWSDADAEGEIDFDADPAIILELMQQAKREGKWIEEDDGDDSDDLGDPVKGSSV